MSFDPLGLDQGPDLKVDPCEELSIRRSFALTPAQQQRFEEWKAALVIVFGDEYEEGPGLWQGYTFSFTPRDTLSRYKDQVVIRHNGTGRELQLDAEYVR